jgi:hypothetical protein
MKSRICRQVLILMSLVVAVVFFAGCSKSEKADSAAATPQPTANAKQPAPAPAPARTEAFTGTNACTLLTKEEIQTVQGEPFTDAISSGKTGSGLSVSQCYFQLPKAVNSIVVTLTKKAEGPGARDPAKNWEEMFDPDKKAEKKEEKEEAEKEPEKVEGIGDEAFWTGNRVGGALYVLKGNSYIRISVGGAGDQADKIRKSKALAQSILGRL